MSININVQGQLDTLRSQLNEIFTEFKLKTNNIQQTVQTTGNQINKMGTNVHQVWSQAIHVTNLIASNLARVATTEEQISLVRDIQFGVQIAQTQTSVVYAGYRAMLAYSEGNIGTGIYQTMIASLMQIQVVELIALRVQSQQNSQRIKDINKYMEMYK